MSEFKAYIQARIDAAAPVSAFPLDDPGGCLLWRNRLRAKLRSLLGGLSSPAPALDSRYGDREAEDQFSRTPVSFAVRPNLRASGYWLEPLEAGPEPGPAMICLPGHGQGVRGIVGLSEEPYEAEFALQCVRLGYRTLALEPLSFGVRRSDRIGPHGWSCEADAKAALMLGETLLGWRVWEAMCGVDWLLDQPGVDPARIGIMGISGGGTVGLWAAALDERLAAAAVSGAFCSFRDSILAIDHCLDNFVPGVLEHLDMPDLAGLIAPRRLFVENGSEDPIFPRQGFIRAKARAEALYAAMGAPGHFGSELFEGGHEFRGQAMFAWLKQSGI